MLMLGRALFYALVLGLSSSALSTKIRQQYEYRSVQVPVSQFYDNVATSDFDGSGASYPVEYLPTGQLISENIEFSLPKWGNGRPDNFISDGQVVTVDPSYIREFHILYAGDWIDGENGAQFEFEFEDTSKQVVELSVKNWWNLHWLNSGPVKTPYHDTPGGRNYNVTQLHHWSTTVSSFSPLKTIRFPPRVQTNRLHLFALTLVPAYAPNAEVAVSPPAISVKNVRLTTLKNDAGDSVVQVTLANLRALASSSYAFTSPHGSAAHQAGHRSPRRPLPDGGQIHLSSRNKLNAEESEHYTSAVLSGPHEVLVRPVGGGEGIRTTETGKVYRLMPGDDARVDVGVTFDSDAASSNGIIGVVRSALENVGKTLGLPTSILRFLSAPKDLEVEVIVVSKATNTPIVKSTGWDLDLSYSGESEGGWEATRESLERHETPRWWNNAKFGIFIHWGVFSVPGWVPTGYYEEWYNWWLHNPAQPSNILWNHHRDTYGEDKLYDDFIPEFNGKKFDAAQWIDLFATAGAKYFVLVTKHHDGFALFDTHNSTHRSSVHLGPERDFIRELMDAAKERQPWMKKGTYYSMPEWFNPDAGPYGFGNWPGHLATGAYNHSIIEPYTGRLEGKDYLKDIQMEHMRILADEYETEIMWCDIGGPNRTLEFAAEWYSKATKAGKQVTMNNRCGVAPDFDTPEYARFSSIQTHSWETSEGIDPYSYGYNSQTKDEEYRSAETIIQTLVDIVSKNGNYLLNLGPTGEGEIIPAMVERLVEVGQWLEHSGPCVFNTTYSFLGAELGSLRFTSTPSTFCITSFTKPTDNLLVVERPVPILPGDTIKLLGAEDVGALAWSYRDGKLAIVVPDEAAGAVKHAWAFEVKFENGAV
ncbi:glycoside hydrolase [Ceratobasidium sp. AG-I]|nr:glycoside hydrolase [Ceratobasidium sp. AG-I]